MQKYIKSYTRDTGFLIQQAWTYAVVEVYKMLSEKNLTYPPIIHWKHKGTIEIYDNEEFGQEFENLLLEKNKTDIIFFDSHVKNLLSEWKFFEELWTTQKEVSADELVNIVNRLNAQIVNYVVYYYSQLNEKSPLHILEVGREIRETDEFFARTDKFLCNTLKKVYPQLGDEVSAITQGEILNPPTKEVLLQRQESFVVIGFDTKEGTIYDLPYEFEKPPIRTTVIKGQTGCKGIVTGKVFILTRNNQVGEVQEGDILVAPMTTPEHVPAMKKAAAFITDEGGITCHAAIIARELKKPCIIGTKFATEILQNGDKVEVNADTGVITIINV